MRSYVLLMAGCLLISCSAQQQSEHTEAQRGGKESLPIKNQDVITQALEWVEYADPVADANMAIDKGLYHLLAVSNKGLSLPGIDLQEHKMEDLQRMCNVRQLTAGGDAIYGKSQLSRLQSVMSYARQYNQIALNACLKQQ